MAPAAVIQRMVRDKEVTAEEPVRKGLLTFFEANPELDFRKDSVLKALKEPDALKNVPEDHREKVVRSLKSCQRLSAICPKAEAVPKLMKVGLDSAYAINEVPLERFVALYSKDLGGEDVARSVHYRAEAISARNEHAYIALREAVLSPSVHMVHGGLSVDNRRALLKVMAELKDIPVNFETLFGSVDLCECRHCNSVYSPAAYLVELLQFLRNNILDPENTYTEKQGIEKTPLEKFFRRRPDLGRLQLTCENTNTLIPYIDLVNEVMESFVVYLKQYEKDTNHPRQATISEYNVEDESSGELLAEPQHTNHKAVQKWLDEEYPALAKKAKKEQAEIHWGDETGLCNDSYHGRSYAPRGQTPAIRVQPRCKRVNLISSVTNQGKVRFMVYEDKMNSKTLIRFMKRLIKDSTKKIFLILDNLKVHHSYVVRDWVENHKQQLEIFYLPSYSPELNPDEY